jgi:hypothetical protein
MGGDGGVGSGADPSGSGSTDSGAGTAAGAVVSGTVSDVVHGDDSSNKVHEEAACDYLKGLGYEGADDMSSWQVRRNIDFEAERARVDGGCSRRSHRRTTRSTPAAATWRPVVTPTPGNRSTARASRTPMAPAGPGPPWWAAVGPQDGVIDPVESEGGPPSDGPWSDGPDVGLDDGPIDVGIDAEPDGYLPPMAAEEPYDDPAPRAWPGPWPPTSFPRSPTCDTSELVPACQSLPPTVQPGLWIVASR